MKRLFEDLWQTRPFQPFSGLQTHAYVLQCLEGNILIYNTGHEDEVEEIAKLGGVKYQYLSHRHETGPLLNVIKNRFHSKLCCHLNEEHSISPSCEVDIIFQESTKHFAGLEIIFTPGHTAGSISFLYHSPFNRIYLFTGDTLYQSNGHWQTLVFPNAGGSTELLLESLQAYRQLSPDVVLSSACQIGEKPFIEATPDQWKTDLDTVIAELTP